MRFRLPFHASRPEQASCLISSLMRIEQRRLSVPRPDGHFRPATDLTSGGWSVFVSDGERSECVTPPVRSPVSLCRAVGPGGLSGPRHSVVYGTTLSRNWTGVLIDRSPRHINPKSVAFGAPQKAALRAEELQKLHRYATTLRTGDVNGRVVGGHQGHLIVLPKSDLPGGRNGEQVQ